ncbi:MAG: WecB/TagA/CpsF family glycosyltransferase [Pseudonocardia sp.]|nr:WecB/TagA/CpsF family glycosyltransferase [Pseudonocardia sp.]
MTMRPDSRPDSRVLFGLRITACSMDDVVALGAEAVRSRRRMLVGVVNAAKIVKLRRDELLRSSLLDCDVILADGQSVVWASRLLGRRLPERITGIDLFERLLELADRDHLRIYLLGARPEVLESVRRRIRERFPAVVIAGAADGYFDMADAAAVAADVRGSHADMLFLGMTTPKKEIFLARYGDELDVPVLHGVGGSFDVLAGVTKRAPLAWQRLGMEWLYRLLQEPRRLFRRYAVTNSVFLALTLKEFFMPTPAYPDSPDRAVSKQIKQSKQSKQTKQTKPPEQVIQVAARAGLEEREPA